MANNSPVMDYDMMPFELSSHCRTLTQRHISSALSPEVLLYVFVCACLWRRATDSDRAGQSVGSVRSLGSLLHVTFDERVTKESCSLSRMVLIKVLWYKKYQHNLTETIIHC